MIYLVKSGENTFEYEKICDEISLLILNPIIKGMNYPHLNGNDIQMLRNSGGTVICKTPDDILIWLVNIEHEQDEKIDGTKHTSPLIFGHSNQVILGDELLDIISNLRNTIKRDLILNKIL
jgi:hypothetical protein